LDLDNKRDEDVFSDLDYDNDTSVNMDEDFVIDIDSGPEFRPDYDCISTGGTIFTDGDRTLDFSGAHDFIGKVTAVDPKLSSIASSGDTLRYIINIAKQPGSVYDYSAVKDSIPFYTISGYDLHNEFFKDQNTNYVLNYNIPVQHSATCTLLIQVTQDGDVEDPRCGGEPKSHFWGTERHCYNYVGVNCPVSGCSGCGSNGCFIDYNFNIWER